MMMAPPWAVQQPEAMPWDPLPRSGSGRERGAALGRGQRALAFDCERGSFSSRSDISQGDGLAEAYAGERAMEACLMSTSLVQSWQPVRH